MKKAKKLLAVIMAAVMLLSAACLPVYAKQAATKYGAPEQMTTNQKYYFNADQGCSYLLDLLDEMLAEAYIKLSWDHLVSGWGWLIKTVVDRDNIDLTSVDNAIQSIYDLIDVVDSGIVGTIGGWIVGDLDYLEKTYLDPSMKRGNRSDNYSTGSNDMKILFSIVSWLGDTGVKDLLARVISGSADLGLLESTITGINIAGMPLLEDIDKYLPVLLYQLLVDDTVTADTMPEGATIETGLQKIVNWALIDGTGEAPENGGTSLLGANFEPLIGNALTYEDHLRDAALIRELRALPDDTPLSYRTPGLDALDTTRNRLGGIRYHYDHMIAQFSHPAFDLLRAEPAYALRFERSRDVFTKDAYKG